MASVGDSKFRNRYVLVAIVFGIVFVGLIIRYAGVMLTGSPDDAAGAGVSEIQRGPILDRNGRLMAVQTSLDTVTAWKPSIADVDRTAAVLADVLERPVDEINAILMNATGYTIIERTITPTRSEQLARLIEDGQLPGIQLEPDTGRSYPERTAAAGIVGYVGVDNVGLAGVEYMYDDELLPPSSDYPVGNQVFLTIDLGVQVITDELAGRLMEEHSADSVMILVLDAKTGALLASSAVPSFDPNHFQMYTNAERKNPAISRIYEPGSVLKIFSLSSIMELGGIDLDDTFNTSGGYSSDDGNFTITDLGDYGVLDAERIIKYSSNVGAAYASETVTADGFFHMLTRFGFGQKTGIELNGEEQGLLRQPDQWSGRTQQTLAIGQEIGVTAIQMVTAATALANEGVLLRPHVIDRIVQPDGEVIHRTARTSVRQVVSAKVAQQMREMMNAATEPDGTARRINVPGVRVSAKTGTAEVYDAQEGTYSDEHFLASTIAMMPTDNPEVIAYLVIDYPKGDSFYGGRIAAPAMGELLNFLVPYLGIGRAGERVVEHDGRVRIGDQSLPEISDVVPDFRGLSKQTLIPLLMDDRFQVEIEGNGWVVQQDPPPGAPVSENLRIRLELE